MKHYSFLRDFWLFFQNIPKLFGHAAHNGSNYLGGHCFVSLMLCLPVWKKDRAVCQSVPLGYRMWTKGTSKPELATDMVSFLS